MYKRSRVGERERGYPEYISNKRTVVIPAVDNNLSDVVLLMPFLDFTDHIDKAGTGFGIRIIWPPGILEVSDISR